MHDDYYEHQRNEDEDITWQYHENTCADDQLFAEAARGAMEGAKKRSEDLDTNIPDFIKVKRKVKERLANGMKPQSRNDFQER